METTSWLTHENCRLASPQQQQQQRSPSTTTASFASLTLADVEAAGPPTAPLGFPAPHVPRGEIVTVRLRAQHNHHHYDQLQQEKSETIQVLRRVLNPDMSPHTLPSTPPLSFSAMAYAWPGVTLQTTLCGHIVKTEMILATMSGCDNKDDNPHAQHTHWLHHRTGRHVVIKVDQRQHLRQLHHGTVAPSENPWKEVAALQLLHQPPFPNSPESRSGRTLTAFPHHHHHDHHVIRLLDVLYDENNLYEVLPYCRGESLHQFLSQHPHGLPEHRARHWFRQLLHAIYYCHAQGICHHDISTQNLLLASPASPCHNKSNSSSSNVINSNPQCTPALPDLVLIDFAMCVRVPHSYPDDDVTLDATDISAGTRRRLIHMPKVCGKLRFLSPEAYRGQAVDGLALDLWAAAVVLFVMLTGRQPYHRPDAGVDADFYDILDEHYYWDDGGVVPQSCSWGHAVSRPAVDLLHGMLHLDPHERLSLAQVMDHPWVKLDGTASL